MRPIIPARRALALQVPARQMRNLEPQRPYTVNIAPTAWRQLGAVPEAVFQRIRRELDAIAALATQRPLPSLEPLKSSSASAALSFSLENFVLIYEVNEERRVLTLLEISQRLSVDSGAGEEEPSI